MPQNKQFTGQRLNDTTRLYYYNARYYDPTIGRFDSMVPQPVLKPKSPQNSFFGSYLYDKIVPADHLLRKINRVVDLDGNKYDIITAC